MLLHPDRKTCGARNLSLVRGFNLKCLGHSAANHCLAALMAALCGGGRKESVARLSLMTYRQHRNRLLGQALAA